MLAMDMPAMWSGGRCGRAPQSPSPSGRGSPGPASPSSSASQSSGSYGAGRAAAPHPFLPVEAAHPNIFIRSMPRRWTEADVSAVCSRFGRVTSLRVARDASTRQSLGYGFVRFARPEEAAAAVAALDGLPVVGHKLQVKLADNDAGPVPPSSGLTPSDTCYAKHLPLGYGAADVHALFAPHGTVVDIKMLPCLDRNRGACAIVRLATVEAVASAITTMNNRSLPGASQPLIVRFAESTEEKAARQRRREAQALQRSLNGGHGGHGGMRAPAAAPANGADRSPVTPAELQHVLAALSLGGGLPSLAPQSPPPQMHGFQAQAQSSVCIQGLPPAADRLWLYETFGRFGAVAGVRVPSDLPDGAQMGSAFVFFSDPTAAERARQAMDGAQVGPNRLLVTAQSSPAVSAPTSPLLLSTQQLGAAQASPADLQSAAAAVLASLSGAGWPLMSLNGLGGSGGLQ